MRDMAAILADAGCGAGEIEGILTPYADGRIGDAIRAARRQRCRLMDALHESQSRVDCLDFLLRELEREQRARQAQEKDTQSKKTTQRKAAHRHDEGKA